MGELAQAAGEAEDSFVFAYYQVTTPNYGACANLHFCEGEYFSADASVSLEAVIPESLAKKLFTERSVGRRLKINGREYTVCGVYKDGPLDKGSAWAMDTSSPRMSYTSMAAGV